jgi:hypothetical protein
MKLVVLNVAFPFAPVGPDAEGSAERVLTQLDAALAQSGHESFVMACEGSITEGILLATPKPSAVLSETRRQRIHKQYRYTLQSFLERWPIDLIHMHGADFYEYLPPAGVPVLVTLHLPVEQYPEHIFHLDRPQTFLHCVSASQQSACPPCKNMLPEIENGVPVELVDAIQAARLVGRDVYQPARDQFFNPGAIDKYFSVYEKLVGEARALETVPPPGETQLAEQMVHA